MISDSTPESETPIPHRPSVGEAFEQLAQIVARLRAPDGCPWDREQTHRSLRPHLLEEAYETLDAIERDNPDDLREELGDLTLQAVLHAQIAHEANHFDLVDVAQTISEKLVRRHPHIFGDVQVAGTADVLANWEAIKQQEKARKTKAQSTLDSDSPAPSILDDIAPTLPALMLALKVSQKAARAGFEWPDVAGVVEKLREETQEVEAALAQGDAARVGEELGDLLFTTVNIARWQNLDPEQLLREMIARFGTRFRHMEKAAQQQNLELSKLSPADWDALWNEAKTSLVASDAAKSL